MMRPGLDFGGRVAIVTGAGRGLGARYALDLASAGASVVVNSRTRETGTAVADEIARTGGRAVAVACDARDGTTLVDAALANYGRIDILVANAGTTRDHTFRKLDDAAWSEVVDLHLGGAYHGCAAVWPHLIERGGGSIVLTASGAGLHGNVGQANYAAAKGGIIALAKTLAIEGERYGIKVNAVAPMALTDMTRTLFEGPLTGLDPAQVAPYVLALAHETCPWTGQVLETGGGWAALLRWERAAGVRLGPGATSADVAERWAAIGRFDAAADHPTSTRDSLAAACGNQCRP